MRTPPVWFLDVDGVVNSSATPHRKHGVYDNVTVEIGDESYLIEYSPRIVARINALVDRELADVTWLTTWNQAARTHLAAAIGLQDFPVCAQPRPGERDWDDEPHRTRTWWKTGRILEHIASTPDQPYVWTDDLLDRTIKTTLRAAGTAPALLLQTMRRPGLTPANLDRIEQFLQTATAS